MLLDILKEQKYISPSSYLAWLNCNYYNYLRKLSGIIFAERFQTLNMAFGSVFDIITKSYFSTVDGLLFDRKKAWNGVTITPDQSFIYMEAAELFKAYRGSELFPNGKLLSLDTEPNSACTHLDIPIFGYLDAVQLGLIPFDWKTKGYRVTYSVSPTAGFTQRVDFIRGYYHRQPVHKRSGEPIDRLDRSWGIQLLFYNWMIEHIYKQKLPNYRGTIHQITYQGEKIIFTEYHGIISDELIAEVERNLPIMWHQIQSGEIPEPEPSMNRCNSYGHMCEAGVHCKYLKSFIENQDKPESIDRNATVTEIPKWGQKDSSQCGSG